MSSALLQEATIELHGLNPDQSLRERAVFFLNRLVFFGLLALIAASAVPYGTVQLWWKMAFVGTVLALTAMWLVEGLLTGTWFVRSHRLLIPLFGLVVYALIQALPLRGGAGTQDHMRQALSADPYGTLLWSFQFLAVTLVGLLLIRYIANQRRFRALIYVVIGIGVASAIFGIARQFMLFDEAGFVLPALNRGFGYGQFINRNHFAYLMEMVLGLVLGLVIFGGVRRNHLAIYLTLGLSVWTALISSNSRGGILSMLCQVILLVVLLLGGVRRTRSEIRPEEEEIATLRRLCRSLPARLLLVVCLLAAVVAGTVWIGGEPLISRLDTEPAVATVQEDELARTSRVDIWRATWRLIRAHPIAGVGFGGYWLAFPGYHDASGEKRPEQAHNDYLEILASGGVVGSAFIVWFLIVWLRQSWKSLDSKDPFRRAACYGALIGLFGVAIHSFVDFGLHIICNALVFTALVVIATTDNGLAYGHNSDAKALQADRVG